MTRTAATTRIMLIEDTRGGGIAGTGATPIRRYRLARLCSEAPSPDQEQRFDYLKRAHD